MVNSERRVVLIIHNVRSAHNVGSIMRSADGFGVIKLFFTGYTPYPLDLDDSRLPHVAKRTNEQIAKTALGAEKTLKWQRSEDIRPILFGLKQDGYSIAALEQTAKAIALPRFKPTGNIALIVGNELDGIEPSILDVADMHLAIPMLGAKESFNASVAAAVALYHLRWYNH